MYIDKPFTITNNISNSRMAYEYIRAGRKKCDGQGKIK